MITQNVILSEAKDLARNKILGFTFVCHWLRQCRIASHLKHWQSQWHTRDTFAQTRELR